MGVELRLVIGHKWGHEEGANAAHFEDFHKKYGKSIHQIADLRLGGVRKNLWALVNYYQNKARDEYKNTGIRYHISTGVVTEDDHEVNEFTDKYGKHLAVIPLRELYYTMLEEFEATKENYGGLGHPRYQMALALIDVFLSRFSAQEEVGHELVALAYGY